MPEQAEQEQKQLYALPIDKLDKQESLAESSNPVRVEFDNENRKNIILLLIATTVVLLAWSWFTELDEIAEAPGQLIPTDEVQPIRAPFDSIVTKIYIKPGDAVKAGQPLLKLDAKTFGAELSKFEHELKITTREQERHQHAYEVLHAFLLRPSELPDDLSSVTEVARAMGDLYASEQKLRRAERDMRMSDSQNAKSMPELTALRHQHQTIVEQGHLKETALAERANQFALDEQKLATKIDSISKQIELQKAGVNERRSSLECTEKQSAAYEQAFKSGASSKTECLDAKIRVEDAQRNLTIAETKLRELDGALETNKHELAQLQSRNRVQLAQMEANAGDVSATEAQVTSRLRQEERDLHEAKARYLIALRAARSTETNELNETNNLKKQVEQLKASVSSEEHNFQKGEMHAPIDGTVALLHLQGEGEVVQHGQDLLTIVPNHEQLVACLHVPNEEIAFIRKDERVKMQFPAYPYQQYGTIDGVVTLIDKFPSQDKEHTGTYKVYLKPQRDWIFCRGKEITLRKGLAVQGELVLRKRRLIIGILAPLLKLQYSHFKA